MPLNPNFYGYASSISNADPRTTRFAGVLVSPDVDIGTGMDIDPRLGFTARFPQVLRIFENTHPVALSPPDQQTSRVSALQRLVLVSTLPRDFCMDLQIAEHQLNDWQLQISTGAGTWLQRAAGGYRLCTARAGRYDVALQHDLKAVRSTDQARVWPIVVSITTP